MKYLKFVFIFSLGIFLFACNNKIPFGDVLDAIDNEIPYEIDSDLDIPTTYKHLDKIYDITFKSNNLDVINENGKIFRSFEDINTSIDITVSNDGEKETRKIELTILKLDYDEIKELILEEIIIPKTVDSHLEFPSTFEYNSFIANLNWISSNENIIANDGKVNFKESKQNVTLSLELSYNDIKHEFKNLYFLEVEPVNDNFILEVTANNFKLPESINSDQNFPAKVGEVQLIWSSSHPRIISENGRFTYPEEDTHVEIEVVFFYKGDTIIKNYTILALTIPHQQRLEMALDEITFPETVTQSLNLKTIFNHKVTGEWRSNNPDIITDTGLLTLTHEQKQFSIILTLKSGGHTLEKEFNLITGTIPEGEIYVSSHHYLGYADSFVSNNFNDLKLDGDRLVLVDGARTGSYESPVFKTINFEKLVASWASISSKTTTAEVQVRVRVNDTWSSYLSYGQFGLGLENKMLNQNGGVARLNQDELEVLNKQTADAFQYKVILRRDSAAVESAKLSLVSMALEIPNYSFNVDISNLPRKVENDLPKLYQLDVPVIGDSICSPTSSAMLLMHKGHTFEDEMPHREAAALFREYNTRIYGNWVFNTVGMSAYGENSYVKRIYSLDELIHHLATVGPVALSIRGNTGRYNTNGHLIVVTGYEITETGRKIFVNDPNLKEVKWEYSEALFDGFTRNVIYVVE